MSKKSDYSLFIIFFFNSLKKLDYGKCSKTSNTKKIIIFSVVRNFRNYVSEKMLVFVILECGLFHEQKRYMCM